MARIKLGEAIERWRDGAGAEVSGRITFQLEETYCTKKGKLYGPYGPYWYCYFWKPHPLPGRGRQISRYMGKPGGKLDPATITAAQLGELLEERQPVELRPVASSRTPAAPRRRTVTAITLVACAATKGPIPTFAKSLYRSDWFRKARAYAESLGDPWYILSAKHGLVSPNAQLSPYDYAMKDKTPHARREWAEDVADQVVTAAAELDADPMAGGSSTLTVRVLAGEQYRRYLVPMLKASGFDVVVPMQGMGIGVQKRWLAEHTDR